MNPKELAEKFKRVKDNSGYISSDEDQSPSKNLANPPPRERSEKDNDKERTERVKQNWGIDTEGVCPTQ